MSHSNQTLRPASPLHGSTTRPPLASSSKTVIQPSGSESACTQHPSRFGGQSMVEHVQLSASSILPSMVPQSLLISANPVATLRIFAEAERAKSHKQKPHQSSSWANAWTRFPDAPSASSQSESGSAPATYTRSRKRPRLPISQPRINYMPTIAGTSTLGLPRSPKRSRLGRLSSRNTLPSPFNPSPTPSTSSASSSVSSADIPERDAYDPYADEDEDEDGSDEYLVPAYACLPPTPLTPQDILQSSTLSRLFSRNNRTFHQIANSATGLVEADLNTCNRMSELLEVLRGDLGGRRWVEVVERAFLAPKSQEKTAGATGRTDKELSLPKLDSVQREGCSSGSSNFFGRQASINGCSKSSHAPSTCTSGGSRTLHPNAHPGTRRIQAREQSDAHSRAQSPLRGSSDAATPAGNTASDCLTDGQRSMLDPRYQILTQAPGFIQSLFVSSEPVTVPVLHRPTNDGRGFHAHQHTSSSDYNTSQKINGISSNPKNHSGSLNPGATETLSIQQQVESYNECAIELSKFLGDLTDYRDRLLEIRNGCLTVEKRKLAMWAIVKLSANGYDEICTGQDQSVSSELSSAVGESLKLESNGTNLPTIAAATTRINGHTGSPCQRGKGRLKQ